MVRVYGRTLPAWSLLPLFAAAAALAAWVGAGEHLLVSRSLHTLFHWESATSSLAGSGAPLGGALWGLLVLAADFALVKAMLDRLLGGWDRYQRRVAAGPPWIALGAFACAVWLCWSAAVVFGAVVLWAAGLAVFLWWMTHAAGT